MKTCRPPSDRVETKLYGPEFRDGWGAGPWQDEPDQINWTDPESGYRCQIRRNPYLGQLCGYVAIPPTHPAHPDQGAGKDAEDALECHGGITWADFERIYDDPNEPLVSNWWQFGFDCGHLWDLVPNIHFMRKPGQILWNAVMIERQEVYRDVAYVEGEIASLITQLKSFPHIHR